MFFCVFFTFPSGSFVVVAADVVELLLLLSSVPVDVLMVVVDSGVVNSDVCVDEEDVVADSVVSDVSVVAISVVMFPIGG
jgi:hypothetical protein